MAATEGEMTESNRDMTAKAMIPARIPRFRRVNTLPDTSPDVRFPSLITFSNLSLPETVYPRARAGPRAMRKQLVAEGQRTCRSVHQALLSPGQGCSLEPLSATKAPRSLGPRPT